MHRPDVRNAIDRKLQTVQIGITDSRRTESEELHRICRNERSGSSFEDTIYWDYAA